jgi:aspartate racemase
VKKLGLVGGIGPASTMEYYKGINEGYQKSLANPALCGENPPMVIDSLNLTIAYNLVEQKNWPEFANLFIHSIRALHNAGAEIAAISANTAHIVFDDILSQSPIPVIGLVDETCKCAQNLGCKKAVIFGTAFTMSSGMYERKFAHYGIDAVIPNAEDQKIIHNILFPNMATGIVLEEDKAAILNLARKMLAEHKADALVLGCTELPLVIQAGDLDTVLLDTTKIHIDAILGQILGC